MNQDTIRSWAPYSTAFKLGWVKKFLFQLGWEVERGTKKKQAKNNNLIIYKRLCLSTSSCGEYFSTSSSTRYLSIT